LVDIGSKNAIFRMAVETATKVVNETAFITVNVGELLFDGYKDPLVSAICDKPFVKPICKSFKLPERIGLFYGVSLALLLSNK
jgi:hypothetical protein